MNSLKIFVPAMALSLSALTMGAVTAHNNGQASTKAQTEVVAQTQDSSDKFENR